MEFTKLVFELSPFLLTGSDTLSPIIALHSRFRLENVPTYGQGEVWPKKGIHQGTGSGVIIILTSS